MTEPFDPPKLYAIFSRTVVERYAVPVSKGPENAEERKLLQQQIEANDLPQGRDTYLASSEDVWHFLGIRRNFS